MRWTLKQKPVHAYYSSFHSLQQHVHHFFSYKCVPYPKPDPGINFFSNIHELPTPEEGEKPGSFKFPR